MLKRRGIKQKWIRNEPGRKNLLKTTSQKKKSLKEKNITGAATTNCGP